MPDIQAVLKAEITRIARKEVRHATADVKKTSSAQRAQISALKRQVEELRRELKQSMRKGGTVAAAAADPKDQDAGDGRRFRATGFANLRKRFTLSAQEMGTLIGVAGQTVYNWEKGEAKPRAAQLAAIAAVRALTSRQAREKLAQGQRQEAGRLTRLGAARAGNSAKAKTDPERAAKKPTRRRAASAETAAPRLRSAA